MTAADFDGLNPADFDAVEAARAWSAQDPDPETKAELDGLIAAAEAGDAGALAELHARFDARLAFGTAGLRGELAAGSNRMNRVLVAQAAAGLAAYLRRRFGDEASVVIGYDGRKNSRVFAEDSAELFAGAGVRTVLLPRLLPTPVLAFAVRHLGTSAGVMVTASHNPARDNGYKVYLGGGDEGSQIVPPVDAEIAAHIDAVAAAGPITALPRSAAYETADESLVYAYVARTAAVAGELPDGVELDVVYTAMHGVGWDTASRVFQAAGLPAPLSVAAQQEPDPAFPTVAFPNPEEPGALDLAVATARESGAELIVANDPDADRLAIAVPDPDADGGWRRLSGNEVGLLLGWAAAEEEAGRPGGADRGTAVLGASIVSSPGLRAIAEHFGLGFAETLTGFKWISRVPGLVFGYEEALGYLVNPETVRDKDGISAAARLLALALRWKASGRTLAEQLEQIAGEIGWYASGQISLRVTDLAERGRILDRLRAEPPRELGGVAVTGFDDLLRGAGALPPDNVLRLTLADGSRVMLRPSGTEPKLKVYLDARGTSRADAEAKVSALDGALRAMLGA
ncbi:phosphohexomutase domain-containing protein [Gryllotalpicola ginsengisoli]|uniref:phospho-sugar mutase n=1 Tax=Gryllotalpicola ginsengisoli TaxID=444608 RepID=UPI0003B46B4F|nr:phospho-sugar mutase [Gryllotalpicola ginsengisoli]